MNSKTFIKYLRHISQIVWVFLSLSGETAVKLRDTFRKEYQKVQIKRSGWFDLAYYDVCIFWLIR